VISRRRMAATGGLIVGLLIGLLAVPASGQDEQAAATTDRQIQVLSVVESPDGEVVIDVAIPGSIGELAPVESNFGVLFNDSLMDHDVRPLSDTVNVVVVIDTSGSMEGEALEDAKLAASAFIEQLPEGALVGVVGVGETAEVLSSPSPDRAGALADIDGLSAVGETALWDALIAAAEIGRTADGGQPYIVVLSDGDDTASTATREEAVTQLREAEVGLYAIAIESPEADSATLGEAVEAADGILTTTSGSGELAVLYRDIAERLSSRYRLRFDNASGQGGNVIISVAANADAVATTRARLDGIAVAEAEAEAAETAEAAEAAGPAQVLNIPEEATLGVVTPPDPGLLGQQRMLPVGAAAMFLSLLVLCLVMLNPGINIRLDAASSVDRIAGINQRLSALAEQLVASRDEEGELDKALDAAGVNLRPGEFTLIAFIIVLVAGMTGFLLGGYAVTILLAITTGVGVLFYLNLKAQRRRTAFADQLTDTLSIMIGSLRSGRGLPQAIELVSEEAPLPTSEQFRRILFENQVGRDLTQSMLGVASRMKSQDFEWVARAVDINRELGGDLIEVLTNVTETIRDRRRIDRMVHSLSAEGRTSGWVLLALPVLMFFFLAWRTPENAELLVGTSLGRIMLLIALTGMVIGYLWIRRLVNVKY